MTSIEVSSSGPSVVPTRTSWCAILSLVLGVLSCPFSLIASIPGLIFGIVGLRKISRSESEGTVPRLTGRGIARAGVVLSAITTLATPVMVAILLPAVNAARNAAVRTIAMNNLKQLSLGMMTAEMTTKGYPAGIVDEQGRSLLSWRVAILPYLGDDDAARMYKEFHLDEPWDSEHNSKLIGRMPDVFASPNADRSRGVTEIVVPVFEGAAFSKVDGTLPVGDGVAAAVSAVSPRALRDGRGKTVLMMAVPGLEVPWTKPADMGGDPVKLLAEARSSGVFSFPIAMADGSVGTLATDTNPSSIRAMFSRDGGD